MRLDEIREMSIDELKSKMLDMRKDLFNSKIQNGAGQLENPSRIRFVRRDIARIKTIIREKELGEGTQDG